jgi:hypothetical protein
MRFVAQACSLLYRRVVLCKMDKISTGLQIAGRSFQFDSPADCKSAIQQSITLRYAARHCELQCCCGCVCNPIGLRHLQFGAGKLSQISGCTYNLEPGTRNPELIK